MNTHPTLDLCRELEKRGFVPDTDNLSEPDEWHMTDYTIPYLLSVLPACIERDGFSYRLTTIKGDASYISLYNATGTDNDLEGIQECVNLVDGLASMLIYLKDNNLI
jgi:hypothetical protein